MMRTLHILVASLLLFFHVNIHGNSQQTADHFIFHGFMNRTADLTLDGAANIMSDTGLLQLTNQTGYIVGHAFYSRPFIFKNLPASSDVASSFSTSFVFSIVPSDAKKGGGHGFAFTITPSKQLPGGSSSHFLGLFNDSNNGDPKNHVFAVEFDTVGAGGAFGDIDSNHVGININSMNSNKSETVHYYSGDSENKTLDLESGKEIRVWIEYDGVQKVVNVTVAPLDVPRPSKPLLSFNRCDLSSIFLPTMYVGFSASTAKLTSSHYILGWSFALNGKARDLIPSKLPPAPLVIMTASSKISMKIVISVVSVVFVLFVTVAFVNLYCTRKRKLAETLEDWELDCPHRFRYKDLYIATNGFEASEIIGTGGFGEVYKGVLPTTGQEVAVKKICHNSTHGVRAFVAEIESLGRLRHKHLVHLLGWCKRKKFLLLVYDFVANGSLDTALLSRKSNVELNWDQRLKILKGIASALLYLHEDWDQVVVHRDVKASNVLLDADMNGRLGDFGLARLYDHGENPKATQVVGTLGYLAPELARTGKATPSSDVFAYGALLLVVTSGRGPLSQNSGFHTLVDWVRECYRLDKLTDAIDPKLLSSYDGEEVELVLKLGLLCSLPNPDLRPSIRQVTRYLNGDDLLSEDNLALDVHLHIGDPESRLAELISKNAILHPSSSSFGPMSCNSLEDGR